MGMMEMVRKMKMKEVEREEGRGRIFMEVWLACHDGACLIG